MNLLDMQILFQQIAEDTSPEFFDRQRSDTYNIINYLNNAIYRYVEKKYISFPTMEQNIRFIAENSNDLKDMIRKVKVGTFLLISGNQVSANDGVHPYTMPGGTDYQGPHGANSTVYHMPTDFMHFVSCHIKSTRTAASVLPTTSAQWQECKVITQDQAGRFISTEWNKPIMREPAILFDADGFFTVIRDPDHDAGITDLEFTYLRKPHTLDFDFSWMNGRGATVLTSAMVNKPVRVRSGSVVEYPTDGFPTRGYRSGSKFNVLSGYYPMYEFNAYSGMEVGYPGNSTDEISLATYMHEDIVRLAVSMFLDEAKFKLAQKATA